MGRSMALAQGPEKLIVKLNKIARPSIGKSMGTLFLYAGALCATYYLTYPFFEIMQGRVPYDSWRLLLHVFVILGGAGWFIRLWLKSSLRKKLQDDKLPKVWRGPGAWN